MKTKRKQSSIQWTHKKSFSLYMNIKKNNINIVKFLLKDRNLVNASLQITGPLAGYTPLHLACLNGNSALVKILVEKYRADINIVADDGAEPIHLACFFEEWSIIITLLAAGANVDAQFHKKLLSKYVEDKMWCNDFGDKITLLTFAIVNKKEYLASILIDYNANLKVKSLRNQTLLMYAAQNASFIIRRIIRKLNSSEFINDRDDDGYTAIHYMLHPKTFGNVRYIVKEFEKDAAKGFLLALLLEAGADISLTVNNDPDTLILNMVAHNGFSLMLHHLLPYSYNRKNSKPLYYTLFSTNGLPVSVIFLDSSRDGQSQLEELRDKRHECRVQILKDLVSRRTFGLPVPEEEVKLMEKKIAKYVELKELLNDYEKNFIHGTLKSHVIQYDDGCISFFDFIMESCNDTKLRRLVKNENLMNAFQNSFIPNEIDYYYFHHFLKMRISKVQKRNKLLIELEKIEQLSKVMSFPYDMILYIFDYLDNYDLENFIDAFYTI